MTTENSDDLLDPAESGDQIDSNLTLDEIRLEIKRLSSGLSRRRQGQLDRLALLAAGRDQLIEGVGNRRWFDTRLYEEVSRSLRGEPLSLLVLDLDNFKPINDTLGHPIGDKVLIDVGSTLKTATRRTDTVARLGGDEFGVILPGIGYLHALVIGMRILAALPELTPQGIVSQLSASIGIVQYQANAGISPTDLSGQADETMYAVKKASKSGLGLYARGLGEISLESIQSDLNTDARIRPDARERLSREITSRTLIYRP